MKKMIVILLMLLSKCVVAQIISPDNRIVILGQASIEMPANQVTFSVSLLSTDSLSLDKVYENHRQLENKIYKLLEDLKIPSKDISYSMFSVGREYDYDTKSQYYMGQQHVTFTIDSVKLVPEIQAALIRGGFSQFNSSFSSTEMENFKKELLEKAVAVAREKATILAKAADRKIKRVVKISDTDESDYTFANYSNDSYGVAASAGGNLIEIPQTVSISTTIKVVFELK